MSATTNVAANVRRARRLRGWTQERLAETLTTAGHAMSAPTLSKIEAGMRRHITVDDLAAFAAALDCTLDALLAEPPDYRWAGAWLDALGAWLQEQAS